MSTRTRTRRPQMYLTPSIRNAGLGALQVEALTNRPLSIARRHTAASQLRMRGIEPEELSSSEWVRFLVMEERERERWIQSFRWRRRNSPEVGGSSGSSSGSGSGGSSASGSGSSPPGHGGLDLETAHMKAEEARLEAEEEAEREAEREGRGRARGHEEVEEWDGELPTYASIVRSHTPPPAYAE